eukprot:tig00000865_g5063.t1
MNALFSQDAQDALQEFVRQEQKQWNEKLQAVLNAAAQTGFTCYDWPPLKKLLAYKLEQVLGECRGRFSDGGLDDRAFREFAERLLVALDGFRGAPFTLQRLCELLLAPDRHYKNIRKLLLAFDKLLSVSTTMPKVDPAKVNLDDPRSVAQASRAASGIGPDEPDTRPDGEAAEAMDLDAAESVNALSAGLLSGAMTVRPGGGGAPLPTSLPPLPLPDQMEFGGSAVESDPRFSFGAASADAAGTVADSPRPANPAPETPAGPPEAAAQAALSDEQAMTDSAADEQASSSPAGIVAVGTGEEPAPMDAAPS